MSSSNLLVLLIPLLIYSCRSGNDNTVRKSPTNEEKGVKTVIPRQEPIDYSQFNLIEFELTNDDRILYNDSYINFITLDSLTYPFVLKHKLKHRIRLITSKETSYGYYLQVIDVLKHTYKRIKDTVAHDQYGLSYAELSDSNRILIDRDYAMGVID